MIDRILDESYPPEVRRHLGTLTLGRLWANACYRFAPPFLAVIARGLDVSLAELGIALAVSELAGLSTPLIGHVLDRFPRRSAMACGLIGVALGSGVAASASGRYWFALGLAILGQSKVIYDLSLSAWIADHVPYDRRGRVIGITETSWAAGLLVGVSLLGIVVAVSSWRIAYVCAAVAVGCFAAVVWLRLGDDSPGTDDFDRAQPGQTATTAAERSAAIGQRRAEGIPFGGDGSLLRRAWRPMLASFTLMAASQCVFVTFGSWLKDSFAFGAARLSAITFVLGGVELIASVTSARRTDAWGKERSTMGGAALMVPAMLLLALLHDHLAIGLVLLGITLVGFEFAIVSSLSVGTQLIPTAPARGLGLMLGAGVIGRAVVSVVGTRLYTDHGMAGPMVLGSVFAACTAAAYSTMLPRTLSP